MSFWIREIAGWFITLLGLILFWLAYDLLLAKRVFEAAPMTFMGFIVFRGGIHLLKVAIAAQAARNLPEAPSRPTRRSPRPAARAVGPTPPKEVLPGPQNARPPRVAATNTPVGSRRDRG